MGALQKFIEFLCDGFNRRHLLWQLIQRDVKNRYLGSALGFFWAFLHPIITVSVLVIVFQFGLKAQPVSDVPFVLWFVTGMVPWFFLSEAFSSGTNAILEYEYLVKKVAFRTSLLPVVKVFSALIVHIFFIGVLLALCFLMSYPIHISFLQVIYYSFCTFILLLGLTWITSSVSVFVRDMIQFVTIVLSFFFWLTPLVWDFRMVPENKRWILNLNPVWYLTEGYRESVIGQQWFWQGDALERTLVFWATTLILFVGGGLLFRQLRPHFADVI